MDETIKQWFRDLYSEAIKETEGTIANERTWQKGSASDEEVEMHERNIETLEEYIELLREKLDALEEE